MNLLTGEYRISLDEKGRILFPAKLKNAIVGTTLVVTQAFDKCLWLFTVDEWNNISSKLMANASPFNEKNRLVLRRFIAPAQELEFDKAGRISIPQSLRLYASLGKDCVVLGIDKYVELWDADVYKEYLSASEEKFLSAAEEMSEISF